MKSADNLFDKYRAEGGSKTYIGNHFLKWALQLFAHLDPAPESQGNYIQYCV